MSDGRSDRGSLVLASSFSAEPLRAPADHLARLIGVDLGLAFAPYGETLAQLADPGSALRRASARAILFRWADLSSGRAPEAAAAELAAALRAADDAAATFILICPGRADGAAETAATARLVDSLAGRAAFAVRDGASLLHDYAVADALDARAERAAEVPYTDEAYAAFALGLVRWRSAALRPPVKLIAVDGDNTLWSGVLGEDGLDGVHLGPGRRALQARLAAAAGEGRIVAILSKNEAADVAALFRARADFPLRPEHVLAWRVNWAAKADNLGAVAAEFGVADESALFLDDNPVECAAMRAAHPEALSVEAPEEATLERFLAHFWPLDAAAPTETDLKRIESYRAEAGRKAAAAAAPTLAEFFRTLELQIDIAPAGPADLARLAQMAARTNQLNATLKRLDERDFAASLADGATFLRKVSVRDRFGDYGVVGCMRARPDGDALRVDLFMLSCRAIGRGVKHRMVASLGEEARARGLAAVAIEHVEGPRNAPVRAFLAAISGTTLVGDGTVILPAEAAAEVVFDPEAARTVDIGPDEAAPSAAPAPGSNTDRGLDRGLGYQRIARDFTRAAALVAAMRADARARPDLATGYAAPAPGLERDIAAIWAEVLRLDRVGAEDSFRELGGRSIDLVRVHGLLAERLGLEVDLAELFRFATVSALARHLNAPQADRIDLARDRAGLMRAARARAAGRVR